MQLQHVRTHRFSAYDERVRVPVQFLSNGRFKNADHQAVVNSECSRLSIATFQNPAPDATVYPLAVPVQS